MKIYVDELPISCFQCPLVIQYDGDNAECVLFKNEWKRLIREYDSNEKLVSCRLADCPLNIIPKEISSVDNISTLKENDIISELGIEKDTLFRSCRDKCTSIKNCDECYINSYCEDKKEKGFMTPAEIAKLVAGV